MGLFDNVDNAQTVAEKDVVKGQRREPLPSNIYNLIIKHAYAEKAKSGALGVHILFEVADGAHKERTIRCTEYVTSGDAKGNKTYYERKTDNGTEKRNLPGYTMINDLAKLAAGKELLKLNHEKKTIKLYDYESRSEKPTEVDMFTELVGKGICGCVLVQIQDKTAKNTQTGEYEPTGQTFTTNVIDKFLDPKERKTASEVDNNINADFKDLWLKKWENQIDDQSTEVKNAGMKGAPAASGEQAEKAPLFG